MATEKFLCMALECTNEVERHPFNFDTGFCESCQQQLSNNYLESIIQL